MSENAAIEQQNFHVLEKAPLFRACHKLPGSWGLSARHLSENWSSLTPQRLSMFELGKDLGKKSEVKTSLKSHRINGPCDFIRSHNPKVVGSNPTPATIFLVDITGVSHQGDSRFFFQRPTGVQNSPYRIPQLCSVAFSILTNHVGVDRLGN